MVAHPATVKAHAPEVEAVVRAVKITVGFGIPDTDVERCTKAEHVVDDVIRTQSNTAKIAVVAGLEVLRLHAPNVVGLVERHNPYPRAVFKAVPDTKAGIEAGIQKIVMATAASGSKRKRASMPMASQSDWASR